MVTPHTHVVSAHEDGAIKLAVEQLIAGNLVALPTETVYGLAADALNAKAVAKIYTAKGRPSHNPLICHVANANMAERYVTIPKVAKQLMDIFWPGPLTLVLKQQPNNGVPTIVSANLPTLAVRCPATNVTHKIIEKLNRPIAAPSANTSGKLSPTSAADVLETLDGRLSLVLDGGNTSVGIESTIISVEGEKITLLRPGTVTVDEISEAVELPVLDRDESQITAPGQLKSHYAPIATVRLNVIKKKNNEVLIGFADIQGDLTLSLDGNLAHAARDLFAILRQADRLNPSAIAIAPIPNEGIGIAINDRLNRAAAPRDT
tara:strand:- start:831 stop:1787 length:957 start_codon:yes stop_codon:yes gene_type:complete